MTPLRRLAALATWLLAASAALAQDLPTCTPPTAPTEAQVRAAWRDASDRGMLWTLRRDGVTSWLYGTVHLGRSEWLAPGPVLQSALRRSAVLALELDAGSPAVRAALARESARLAAGAPPLPQALRQRITALAPSLCLAAAPLLAEHPAMQLAAMGGLAAAADGLHPAFAQEMVLAAAARQFGVPVDSLETVETQIAALVPDPGQLDLPAAERTLTQLEDGSARRALRRLIDAWTVGDLDTLASMATWCGCLDDDASRAALRRLNDDRNPALADAIVRLHARGQPVFAAVGALHMTGAQALPALLAARGFVVERVPLAPR